MGKENNTESARMSKAKQQDKVASESVTLSRATCCVTIIPAALIPCSRPFRLCHRKAEPTVTGRRRPDDFDWCWLRNCAREIPWCKKMSRYLSTHARETAVLQVHNSLRRKPPSSLFPAWASGYVVFITDELRHRSCKLAGNWRGGGAPGSAVALVFIIWGWVQF